MEGNTINSDTGTLKQKWELSGTSLHNGALSAARKKRFHSNAGAVEGIFYFENVLNPAIDNQHFQWGIVRVNHYCSLCS
jgi:hypothetical protein